MSYSHLVDQTNEMSTSPAGSEDPNSPALDLPRLQGLLGRNLMVYQDLELLMKELASIVYIAAPLKQLDDAVKARRERIQKMTLGGTVEDVMRLFEPYVEGEAPDSAGIWFEAKLTIGGDAYDIDKERQQLADVIAERNWLVHGSLRELCFSSDPQIRVEAEARIERQHKSATELVATMRDRLRHLIEARNLVGEFYRKVTLPTMLFQSQARVLLADPRAIKQAQDGSFLLQRLLDLIRGRGRLSTENFKTLRELGVETLLQEIEPRLTFEDRDTGERRVRFGIMPTE